MESKLTTPILQILQHELGSVVWTAQNRRRIRATLARCINSYSIAGAIQSILDNEDYLNAVCDSSYIHQLGFAKFILTPVLANGTVLRLHIWTTPEYFSTQDDAHDHQHDFCSTILMGSLIHTIYAETDLHSQLSVTKFSYNFDSATQTSIQRQLGKTSLARKHQYKVDSGKTYFFPHNLVHSVRAQAPLTITAILQAPAADKTVSVYKYNNGTPRIHESRGHCDLTRANAIQLLRQARSALEAIE